MYNDSGIRRFRGIKIKFISVLVTQTATVIDMKKENRQKLTRCNEKKIKYYKSKMNTYPENSERDKSKWNQQLNKIMVWIYSANGSDMNYDDFFCDGTYRSCGVKK